MRLEHRIFIVSIVAITWLVFAYVFGLPDSYIKGLQPFGLSITASTIVWFLYDKWLWKFKVFHGWLTRLPNIQGCWKVEFISSFIDPNTGKAVNPTLGYAQIDQTSSQTKIRMYTAESMSESQFTEFQLDMKTFKLSSQYLNRPQLRYQPNSGPHRGTSYYEIRGYNPKEFAGEYWTDRLTSGSVNFLSKLGKGISSYEDGQKLESTL